MLLPPKLGIFGEVAVREALGGDYVQIGDLLRGALRRLLQMADDADPFPFLRALFDSSLVVERGGKLFRYPYTITGMEVSFGDVEPVYVTFAPVSSEPAREAKGAFLEAKEEGTGAKSFRIRVIRAGISGNGNYYPDAALREAVSMFEGARVFVKSDKEHLAGEGKDVRNLVGALANVAFVEGASPDTGAVLADLRLLEPHGEIAVKLREAWDQGMTGLFGFSIDADAKVKTRVVAGRKLREAVQFTKVSSVDLIVEPGAGGEIVNFIEAKEESDMFRKRMIRLIEAKRPELLRDKDVDNLSDEDIEKMVEALTSGPALGDRGEARDAGATREDIAAAMKMVEARASMRVSIAESGLPQAARDRLRKDFEAMERFTESEVEQRIKDEREYLGRFAESGRIQGLGDGRIEPGESRAEKVSSMLDAFFDQGHKDHGAVRSFKEAYIDITGDRLVTGLRSNCDSARLREALGTSELSDVLGSALRRRMIADYRTPDIYSIWRNAVVIDNAVDFRTQERARMGGYGDLPGVNEAGDYQALTSPSDEKATFAVTKRGGLESITLEAIKNDDVAAIRQVPVKLSRAAKRTLAKFVFDFVRTNPTIYDSVAFFHATHGNLGAAALDATTYAAARLAMLKQTELSSADRLGIGPRFLLVPADLEEAAANIFRRNTNQDKTFIQSLSPDILPIWYWTDANDWAVLADPMDIPTITVGFLDGNEEPEIFVQDSPTGGSMFSSDKLTWKIRHIYGGAVTDYRGAYKAVVA